MLTDKIFYAQQIPRWVLSILIFLYFVIITNEAFANEFSKKMEFTHAMEVVGSASRDWNSFITPLTKEELWIERDAYDASHVLMVPMHYAFLSKDKKGISEFEILMWRFARNELPGGQLNQVQWMYFVSRYLVLRAQAGLSMDGVYVYLVQRVALWLFNKWELEPAYQWGRLPFFGSRERISYIESKDTNYEYDYYKAITDHELFLFAIAGDINFIFEQHPEIFNKFQKQIENTVRDILKFGVDVISRRGSFRRGSFREGWLFQVGIWSEHPDYRWSGHDKLSENLAEALVSDIAEDSSHSHRWPLFFHSMLNAPAVGDGDKAYLMKAYSGFCYQFKNVVVKKNKSGVLLRNFMDGRNGVYRYKYETVGSNSNLGYGAYALSGILGESWYPFCKGVSDVFMLYKNSYPLSRDVLEIYVGPNTTRARNPLFRWPNYFTSGFAALHARQSAYISKMMDQ